MSTRCPTCNRPILAAGPRFCPHCGAPMRAAAPPPDLARPRPDLRRAWGAPGSWLARTPLAGVLSPGAMSGRSPLYWLYRSWRWLVFAIFVGCVAVFFVSAGLPLPKSEQNAFCWISALGAMFSGAIVLAGLPGSIAHGRAHPHALVITICGWIGMFFTGGILWFIALIWALTAPQSPAPDPLRYAD